MARSTSESGGPAHSAEEAQATLDAIAAGHVDAVVVHGPHGPQVFHLAGPDHPFRTLVERMQDDGVYLSSPSNYFNDDMHIYQNLLRDIFSAFAANNRGGPTGDIYIYRNLIDQRQGVPFNRPSPKNPQGGVLRGHGFLAHGNDLLGIESLHFYHNTFVTQTWSGSYAARTWTTTHPRTRRTGRVERGRITRTLTSRYSGNVDFGHLTRSFVFDTIAAPPRLERI